MPRQGESASWRRPCPVFRSKTGAGRTGLDCRCCRVRFVVGWDCDRNRRKYCSAICAELDLSRSARERRSIAGSLPPLSSTSHPRALPSMPEANALWCGSRVPVVLHVDETCAWPCSGLTDAFRIRPPYPFPRGRGRANRAPLPPSRQAPRRTRYLVLERSVHWRAGVSDDASGQLPLTLLQ